ncbi:type VI secretion system baseplate subunit TssE [Thioclava sp. SK-1]|uniref:type VI secretion system baseplate subunit TssE n=1 Tax=Thioclava sp. SK-1 TaxID=1889770 RepID=UPI000AE445C1|nr:type VI secretion system baseplate subunit TssE [Thioclava sp. SK-1]
MTSSELDPAARRHWRRDDRAKVSILQVFRASFADHDARRAPADATNDGRETSSRSKMRRDGVSEDTLRAHLEYDLNALLNTIRLDAASSLKDAPHVARSILNYGFRDLSGVPASSLQKPDIIQSIRQSLIDHEPRLVKHSISITVADTSKTTDQRLSLTISAELMGDPVDIPLDFDAEVDLGAGKMKMSKLRVQL